MRGEGQGEDSEGEGEREVRARGWRVECWRARVRVGRPRAHPAA